jgi:hypothetical protein
LGDGPDSVLREPVLLIPECAGVLGEALVGIEGQQGSRRQQTEKGGGAKRLDHSEFSITERRKGLSVMLTS